MFKVNNKDNKTTPGPYHIQTSPLVCSVNPWTGFYMIGTWRPSCVFIVDFEHICSAIQWTGFYMIETWRRSGVFIVNFEQISRFALLHFEL